MQDGKFGHLAEDVCEWLTANGERDQPESRPSLQPDLCRTRRTAAVADNIDRHGQPTPLLRGADDGFTWTEDDRFLEDFPSARVWNLTRAGRHWIAAGWAEDHVDAWISTDRRHWEVLPAELRDGAGGTLSLIAVLDSRIVVMGTAPELDRFDIYDLADDVLRPLVT